MAKKKGKRKRRRGRKRPSPLLWLSGGALTLAAVGLVVATRLPLGRHQTLEQAALAARLPVPAGGLPPARAADAATTGVATADVPFDLLHHHVFVTASLNGVEGTWLVDTGSNLTVMSPRSADMASCPAVDARADRDPYGIGRFVRIDRLSIGAVSAGLPVAGVMGKMADQILRDDGVFVAGILGYDWLSHFRVSLDYKRSRLTLGESGLPDPAGEGVVVPMRLVHGVPVVPVRLGTGPARDLLLDTGANVVNIPWDFAQASGVKAASVVAGPRLAGLTGRANTGAMVVPRLEIGRAAFRKIPVSLSIGGDGFSARYGNIGNSLFLASRLTLDARNHQVVIDN